MELLGYKRSDGRIGFRNHVLVVPLTGCQMEVARRITAAVPGATCLGYANGCDLQMQDFELFGNILEHFVTHPNVGGVLFLAMGCAAPLSLHLPAKAASAGRLTHTLGGTQAGTTRTVDAGVKIVRQMVETLRGMKRESVGFSSLIVGTKCGASDANSFAYCHPVVGRACDMLVEKQATVVLSENCELVAGAAHLIERAETPEIGMKIRNLADEVNRGWKSRFGISIEELALQSTTTATETTFRNMEENIDLCIAGVIDGKETVDSPPNGW